MGFFPAATPELSFQEQFVVKQNQDLINVKSIFHYKKNCKPAVSFVRYYVCEKNDSGFSIHVFRIFDKRQFSLQVSFSDKRVGGLW